MLDCSELRTNSKVRSGADNKQERSIYVPHLITVTEAVAILDGGDVAEEVVRSVVWLDEPKPTVVPAQCYTPAAITTPCSVPYQASPSDTIKNTIFSIARK